MPSTQTFSAGANALQQANALLRKNLVQQRRAYLTNLCLVSAPIVFCVLLAVFQLLINTLVLTRPEAQCGCQCTKCCRMERGKPVSCGFLETGYCDVDRGYECFETNDNNCGVQYSSSIQAIWCEIPYPSSWPPVTRIPPTTWRARPWRPNLGLPYTSTNPPVARNVTSNMFRQLNATIPALLSIMRNLMVRNGTQFNGYLLSELGMDFANTRFPPQHYYIDSAFVGGGSEDESDRLYLMMPPGTCAQYGVTASNTTSFTDLLLRYFLGPNPNLRAAITILQAAQALPPGFNLTAVMESPAVGLLNRTLVSCVETFTTPVPTLEDMNYLIYCGFRDARCNSTSVIRSYAAAWDFNELAAASHFNTTVLYNLTLPVSRNTARNYRLPAMVNDAVRGWSSYFLRAGKEISTELLGLMSFPKPKTDAHFDLSSLLGPLFYTWVVQLLMPTFLQQLVYEKEKRLRMMMKMHGLGDPAYWLITYCWYMLLYIVYIAIFIIVGAGAGLKYFRKTNLGIQIIFYFLHGQCMIAFAFMLSSLFSSSTTATVTAYLYVFASGLIGSLLLQTFMRTDALWCFFVEWVPAWSLYRGLFEMGQYAFLGVYRNEPGMQFSDLSDAKNGMLATWGIFLVEWPIFMLLGWYFEQVISTGNGIKRHPLFFLEWCWRKKQHDMGSGRRSLEAAAPPHSSLTVKGPGGEMADVAAERARVEGLTDVSNTPIVIKDLAKTYPGLDGGKPKRAVRNLTMAIERGECFGLLGPNGAGKTTSINMLVGFLEPSGGSAIIEGRDIRREMQDIYKMMGVCPQHDLLWEQLTGREHLFFYGRLKGLQGAELADAVESGLQSVNLLAWGNRQARQYSGGMKRRLSVAISFIGRPQVVYLDEPSTGLDPASRRGLWEVVKGHKSGRATILTTHSMEEAEMLCDRLGIFVDGQLVCIGNPKEITSRYAGYLVFTITVPPHEDERARQVVADMSPSAVLTYELNGTLKYELPTSEVSLSSVFASMSRAKESGLQVLDWGVANATLEEVFIKLARRIGADTKELT
mmetsp:Transcript_33634/g.74460  ORF Transcript_33634/g.74460 Transcript_33634/m.74460 type:complete len:1035 (+) Transcript_33634:121-3225(+)